MKATLDQVMQAFIGGYITVADLYQILVDNYGPRKARQIIRRNLELALQKEKENGTTP